MSHDIAAIAARLTPARKRLILALPDDENWGVAPNRGVAKRLWWNHLPPLIDHKHCPEDRSEWALTSIGAAVRRHLESTPPAPDCVNAIKRVRAIGEGATINGTYRKCPADSLETFRADLRALCDAAEVRA